MMMKRVKITLENKTKLEAIFRKLMESPTISKQANNPHRTSYIRRKNTYGGPCGKGTMVHKENWDFL